MDYGTQSWREELAGSKLKTEMPIELKGLLIKVKEKIADQGVPIKACRSRRLLIENEAKFADQA